MRDHSDVIIRPPKLGDWGWVLGKHEEVFVGDFGWNHALTSTYVAKAIGDIILKTQLPGQRSWFAEVNGVTMGCIHCIREDETTARIKLLLVIPEARGKGIGFRLVKELIQFVKDSGYSKIVLFTTSVQTDGLRLYDKFGFESDKKRTKCDAFGPAMEEVHLKLNIQ